MLLISSYLRISAMHRQAGPLRGVELNSDLDFDYLLKEKLVVEMNRTTKARVAIWSYAGEKPTLGAPLCLGLSLYIAALRASIASLVPQ